MKIAHIAPPWIAIPPKNYGGTEIVVYNLVEAQVALGHDVTIFAPGDARTSARHVSFFSQSLLEAGVPWGAHLKAYYHLQRSLEQAKEFDIIHTHLSSSADLYSFPLLANLGTPHVTTLHSRFPFDRVQRWVGDADQYYIDEWGSRIPLIAISESARAEAVERSAVLNFVGVVHHGLPIDDIRPTRGPQGDYFVWLGRIVPDKGTHLAIEAAKKAGVKLILAGTIDRHIQESVNYFQDQIKPQLDDDQIKYIGPVNMKQKNSLMSHARGFLNPILWEEPFGMVMIEAMGVGCPVISFSRGAAPELLVHRKTGFLVHDVNEMARFIPRIDEIDREATRAHVRRNFSSQAMAEKYLKIYSKVINQSRTIRRPFPVAPLKKPLILAPASDGELVKTGVVASAAYSSSKLPL